MTTNIYLQFDTKEDAVKFVSHWGFRVGQCTGGYDKKTMLPVISVDREKLDRACSKQADINEFLEYYAVRIDGTDFVADPKILRHDKSQKDDKSPEKPKQKFVDPHEEPWQAMSSAEQRAAEAEGMSRIATDNVVRFIDTVSGLSYYIPHALVVGIGTSLIIGGCELYRAVENMDVERRFDTINRVNEDPLAEELNAQPKTKRKDSQKRRNWEESIETAPQGSEEKRGR